MNISVAQFATKTPPGGGASTGPPAGLPAPHLLGDGRGDGDEASALALVVELDHAVDFGVERVVTSHADVDARVELRAALANDDRSAGDELSREALHAEHFRLRVAAVARRSLSFFVSHGVLRQLDVDG